jgi:myo-inositol-1(or 4)-monophosphatase
MILDKALKIQLGRKLMNIEKVKQVGIGAAYRAGKILKEHFGKLEMVKNKGTIDLVTEADIAAEKAIVDAIKETFPDHSIVAEESGSLQGDPDNCWFIDPLDGTTNYAHNLGFFSVSIAFFYKKKASVGIVFNPVTAELFTATKGQGAQLNNHPISVSDKKTLQESLLVTGFPYNLNTILFRLITRFQNCLSASQGVRRLGSAALDLCYVACGRFDGFWEENLNPWDTAAGVLIAQEAGAVVTDFKDRPFHINKKQILATNGHIHSEMVTLLN